MSFRNLFQKATKHKYTDITRSDTRLLMLQDGIVGNLLYGCDPHILTSKEVTLGYWCYRTAFSATDFTDVTLGYGRYNMIFGYWLYRTWPQITDITGSDTRLNKYLIFVCSEKLRKLNCILRISGYQKFWNFGYRIIKETVGAKIRGGW